MDLEGEDQGITIQDKQRKLRRAHTSSRNNPGTRA